MPAGRLAIVCPWAPPERSAVTQYVLQVAAGLARTHEVHVVWSGASAGAVDVAGTRTWRVDGGVSALLATLGAIGPARAVIQYSPYLWAHSGFDVTGPALVTGLARAGTPADVLWHELWVPPIPRPVAALRGLFQRAMAAVIGRTARRSIVTSAERVGELCSVTGLPASRFALVPMASLVPVEPTAAAEREVTRTALGLSPGQLALVLFGFDHDSRPTAGLAAVHRALAAAGVASRLVIVGTARVKLDGAARDWPLELGYCAPERVSRVFAAADLFLAPFVDGISTRRTSTAAAFAHGLPVVTTVGPHTDKQVFHPGVAALAPIDDPAAFARAVVEVALAPDRRAELARAGLTLFADLFAWPRHLAALAEVHA